MRMGVDFFLIYKMMNLVNKIVVIIVIDLIKR